MATDITQTLADLQGAVTQLQTDVAAEITAVGAAVTSLETEIASLQAGNPVSQTTIDAIEAQVTIIKASSATIEDATTKLAQTPPAAP